MPGEEANKGRVFEVLAKDKIAQWVTTQFIDLKVNDIIRIKDNGRCYAVEENNMWVVVDTKNICNGKIDVLPYRPKKGVYFCENVYNL